MFDTAIIDHASAPRAVGHFCRVSSLAIAWSVVIPRARMASMHAGRKLVGLRFPGDAARSRALGGGLANRDAQRCVQFSCSPTVFFAPRVSASAR
jgi:hypothetical protein